MFPRNLLDEGLKRTRAGSFRLFLKEFRICWHSLRKYRRGQSERASSNSSGSLHAQYWCRTSHCSPDSPQRIRRQENSAKRSHNCLAAKRSVFPSYCENPMPAFPERDIRTKYVQNDVQCSGE